jgi:hypothetical protein
LFRGSISIIVSQQSTKRRHRDQDAGNNHEPQDETSTRVHTTISDFLLAPSLMCASLLSSGILGRLCLEMALGVEVPHGIVVDERRRVFLCRRSSSTIAASTAAAAIISSIGTLCTPRIKPASPRPRSSCAIPAMSIKARRRALESTSSLTQTTCRPRTEI